MKNTQPRLRRSPLLLLAALCLCAAAAAAQPSKETLKESVPTPAQKAEAVRLRGALEAAVGEHFEVARERLTRRSNWHGGQLYWLAHLRAKRPGGFYVRYKYRYKDHVRPHDPLYTFVEHQTYVGVGPKGCDRRPRSNSVCVGDTFILPVLVNDHTEHAFSLEARPYTPGDPAAAEALRGADEAGLHREPVHNPAEKFMKYLGSRAHYSPHRAPGYTMDYYATFEAVAPGAFNLSVGLREQNPGPAAAAPLGGGSTVPVVIVARGEPITVLSAKDDVHGYTGRFSSRGGGTNYLTTHVVMQVGERLTLRYHGFSVRGRSPAGENRLSLEGTVRLYPPSVRLAPFRVDPAQDYNEWVAEFLPPTRRE